MAQSPWEWNLGEVESGQVYQTRISLVHESLGPLQLLQARPSCGCLTARIEQSPNQPAILHLTLDTTGLISPFRKYIYLQTDHTDQPVQRLSVNGTLKQTLSEPLSIQFYYDPSSSQLASVQAQLTQVEQRYEDQVSIQSFDMTQVAHYTRLYQLEDRLGVIEVHPLEVFVGEIYLGGEDEIRQRLGPLVDGIMRGDLGSTSAPSSDALVLHFYHSPGCRQCREIKALLYETQQRLSQQSAPREFTIRLHDVSEPEVYAQLVSLEEEQGVISNEPMSLLVGKRYLAGANQIRLGLEDAIQQATLAGDATAVASGDRNAVARRFRSFSVAAVLGAGLLDGLNPCAFTTLVFFLSLLSYTGRRRAEIALVGVCFGLAVFVTYLAIGLGVFHAFQALQSYHIAATGFTYLAAGVALVFAAYSIYDAVAYAHSGRSQDIKLQLPQRIKRRIHQTMRENLKTKHLAVAALLIGGIVSVLESVCTGQVYLPTIALVTRDPILRLNAVAYLLLYNLMFILPLIVVFTIAYFGVGSHRMAQFARQHLVATKLATAGLFVGLALLMIL